MLRLYFCHDSCIFVDVLLSWGIKHTEKETLPCLPMPMPVFPLSQVFSKYLFSFLEFSKKILSFSSRGFAHLVIPSLWGTSAKIYSLYPNLHSWRFLWLSDFCNEISLINIFLSSNTRTDLVFHRHLPQLGWLLSDSLIACSHYLLKGPWIQKSFLFIRISRTTRVGTQ